MPEKIDKIEKDRRVRIVMEWILEDWPVSDIVTQIVTKWGVCERQAKRYIKDARDAWNEEEDAVVEQKRRTKIQSLRKLKRSLREQYKGTPLGIRAILAVEKQIIELEGLKPVQKSGGDGEDPPPADSPVPKLVLSRLSEADLQTIIALNKKAAGL